MTLYDSLFLWKHLKLLAGFSQIWQKAGGLQGNYVSSNFIKTDSQEKRKSKLWTVINLPQELLFLFGGSNFKEMQSNYFGKRRQKYKEMYNHIEKLWRILIQLS